MHYGKYANFTIMLIFSYTPVSVTPLPQSSNLVRPWLNQCVNLYTIYYPQFEDATYGIWVRALMTNHLLSVNARRHLCVTVVAWMIEHTRWLIRPLSPAAFDNVRWVALLVSKRCITRSPCSSTHSHQPMKHVTISIESQLQTVTAFVWSIVDNS
jgi:hypothetical protein